MRVLTKSHKLSEKQSLQNNLFSNQNLHHNLLQSKQQNYLYKLPKINHNVNKNSFKSPLQRQINNLNNKTSQPPNIYIKIKQQNQKQKSSHVKIYIPPQDPAGLAKRLSKLIQFNNQRLSCLQNQDIELINQPIKSITYQSQTYKQKLIFLNQIFIGCGFQIKQKDVLVALGQKSQIYYIFFTNCPYHPISLCCQSNILLKNFTNKTTMICTNCSRQIIKFIPKDLKQYFVNKQKSKSSHIYNYITKDKIIKLDTNNENNTQNLNTIQNQNKSSLNNKNQTYQIKKPSVYKRIQNHTQASVQRKHHQSKSINLSLNKQQNNQHFVQYQNQRMESVNRPILRSRVQSEMKNINNFNNKHNNKIDLIDEYNHHQQNSIQRERMKINFSLLIASGRYRKMRINQSIKLLDKIKNDRVSKNESYFANKLIHKIKS